MNDFKDWPPEYQAALKAYAEAKGKHWEQRLCEDWATGKDTRFPEHGASLRGIRNHPECAPVIYERAWGKEES